MKKKSLGYLVIGILFACLCNVVPAEASSPPKKGGVLPPIDLPIPEETDYRTYLGLSGTGTFRIPQIKAQIVIIEIFNMY